MLSCHPKLASEAQSILTSHHFEEIKVYKEVHNLFSTIQNPKNYENSTFEVWCQNPFDDDGSLPQDGSRGPLPPNIDTRKLSPLTPRLVGVTNKVLQK